jgi:hypothetical protein
MNDDQLIESYLRQRSYTGAAALGLPKHTVYNRLMRLRRAGVRLPKSSYSTIEAADIERLNQLIDSYREQA